MANLIVASIILLVIALAIAKIVHEKKKGVKCIGCPHSGTKNKKGGCSC